MYAERVVTLQPRGPQLVLAVINDSAERWEGPAQIRRIDGEGNVLASLDVTVSAAPRTVQELPIPSYVTTFGEPTGELVVVNFRGSRSIWYGSEPKDSTFPVLSPHIEAISVEGGLDVTVTARTLVRDLLVQADRIDPDATADRGFITLLPGESVTVRVRSPHPISSAQLDAPYVLTHLDEVATERARVVTLQ
jgi:beta-mannosidase